MCRTLNCALLWIGSMFQVLVAVVVLVATVVAELMVEPPVVQMIVATTKLQKNAEFSKEYNVDRSRLKSMEISKSEQ
jgi:hypothetical protein